MPCLIASFDIPAVTSFAVDIAFPAFDLAASTSEPEPALKDSFIAFVDWPSRDCIAPSFASFVACFLLRLPKPSPAICSLTASLAATPAASF